MAGFSDIKTNRECSEPFESRTEANEVIQAFFQDLQEIRKKHKIANVLCTLSDTYYQTTDGEPDEGQFLVPLFLGDSINAESMAAYTYGREQENRQTRIMNMLKSHDVIYEPAGKPISKKK